MSNISNLALQHIKRGSDIPDFLFEETSYTYKVLSHDLSLNLVFVLEKGG